MADGGRDVQVDDIAVPLDGGLPPLRGDCLVEPASEPVAHKYLFRREVDALVERGEEVAQLALCGGLGAGHGGVLAAPLAEGGATEVDGELP